jgi:hypothetical protein
MRNIRATRMTAAFELPSAHVECALSIAQPKGGLLVLSEVQGRHLSVGGACPPWWARLGDDSDARTGLPLSPAQCQFGNHEAPITGYPSRFSPQRSVAPCRVTDDLIRVVVPSEHREPRDLCAASSVTLCRAIPFLSHRKQTIGTVTKCHTFSTPPRSISWPVHRSFRIISAPISHKEPRVQGR